jgi:hypothetical protein
VIARPSDWSHRSPRAGLLAAAALALLVAGCGDSSRAPAVATVRGTTSSTPSAARTRAATSSRSSAGTGTSSGSHDPGASETARQAGLLRFSRCMRSHGVLDFPDLSATIGVLNVLSHSGVDTRSPAYAAALHACEKYSRAGLTPAQSAADNAEGLRFSQCMRSHGVPGFPDPTTGPIGEQVINLRPAHIDPNSPALQAASRACRKVAPLGK